MFFPDRFKYRFSPPAQMPDQGFTLSEVLIAILLATTFVAVALQGLVVAMLLKSKAFQVAEANRWVQADLEQIRSQITLNQIPLSPNRSRCHPAQIEDGFADLIRDNLAKGNVSGGDDYQLSPIVETSKMGKTFQIARTLSIPATPENTQAKILGIQYLISPTQAGTVEPSILHFYTEVMADAALQCQ
jgi:prepilin-type N-terminal cleavage/methylation domain-containing protein